MTFFFLLFPPLFRCFTFFQLRERVLPRPFQRRRRCCTYKSSSEIHSINLRTASSREHLQSPLHRAAVHTVVRSCRPECDNASKLARNSKSSVAESHCTNILYFFFSSLNVGCSLSTRYSYSQQVIKIFQAPLTLSPLTGRRLDHISFRVDIGVIIVTKNNRLFTVTSTTCCLLYTSPSPRD